MVWIPTMYNPCHRLGWRPRMLPGAGWWCVTRASGSTSPPTSGSPRSSPAPGPRRGSAASPSTRYLHSYLQYLQYLYSVSTIFIQFIYTLHCNEISPLGWVPIQSSAYGVVSTAENGGQAFGANLWNVELTKSRYRWVLGISSKH